MKRLSLALVIAVASGPIAAGCGGDDEGGEATTGSGEIAVSVPTEPSELYDNCIASLEGVPENVREEAREGCEALKQ